MGDGGKMGRKEENPQIPYAALGHLLEAPGKSPSGWRCDETRQNVRTVGTGVRTGVRTVVKNVRTVRTVRKKKKTPKQLCHPLNTTQTTKLFLRHPQDILKASGCDV